MNTIRDLLSRDLSQPIEEVIKLDQQDEQTVYNEITEYVATERIQRQYLQVLKAISDAPSDPTEGVGVWISGFFGSGKSSFAKNLGYVLSNRSLQGEPAGRLFIEQLRKQAPLDPLVNQIADRINFINTRFDSQVIMFDVQVDRAVRRSTEPIAEIMYTVLLRELDYAQDFDVAELEIELEAEGRLADFVRACAALSPDAGTGGRPTVVVPTTLSGILPDEYFAWQRVRAGALRIQRASAALNAISPATFPTPDSWAASLRREPDITIRTLVERTFDLTARRRPDHAVIFIIDEVGAYVARSVEKIENLRAVVEHFGVESKNRVLAHKAVAPVWVIVTSQEKLDEVVAAIDDKRVELAKLQDRFRIRVDMAPADIREVASRRVLSKKPAAEPILRAQFDRDSAMLKTHTKLERTTRQSEAGRDEFVQFYPYLPHYVDLSIDIVSGIRLQPGAPKHIGGSARTLIKQAYEMLVNERTGLADKPVGELVTLDRIYDLIEATLTSERRKDISDIGERWPADPWPARAAKAIALLEYVRDLPRSEANLAALLYRRLGDESPLPHVQRAVGLLRDAQFIRQTESGWKLQTAQEKSWTVERNAFNPTPRERNDLLEGALRKVFAEPALTRYHYRNLRTFRVGVTWEGRGLTAGDTQVPFALRIADGPEAFDATSARAREDSRLDAHRDELLWVVTLNETIDEIVAELYRSKQMESKYNQLRAQGKITNEESSSLEAEKSEGARLQDRLEEQVLAALAVGRGFFRGVSKDGAQLGRTPGEILKGFFDYAVPDLYTKLEMGARALRGNEAEEILKAANLTGLPKVFYGPPDGLELVTAEGTKYVVNLSAPIVKEVAEYLAREHSYGNKVTGRTLEGRFSGLGYGWDGEMLWLVLATLLRGGAIEVTYGGRRYRSHLDPQARIPFSGTNAFRSASFAPRKAPDLQTLVKAARRYEEITGEEVDIEESTIAAAFQRLARVELQALLRVEAVVNANHIPLAEILAEYHTTLETILNSASDDCVNMLAGEGEDFQELRKRVAAIAKATDEKGLARLRRLRAAVGQIWPALQAEEAGGGLEEAAMLLQGCLADGSFYLRPHDVDKALHHLEDAYGARYQERHSQRKEAFRQAADEIKGQPAWPLVPEGTKPAVLKPLANRGGHDLDLPPGALTCKVCGASLAEMASDLAAVDRLRSDALLRVQQLTQPEQKIERLRIAEVVGTGQTLGSEDEVNAMLDQLRDRLMKLINANVTVILE